MVAFIDNQVAKIKELIASIVRHYEVDLISYDGFHTYVSDSQQLPATYIGDLLLLLECFSLEQVFVQGRRGTQDIPTTRCRRCTWFPQTLSFDSSSVVSNDS